MKDSKRIFAKKHISAAAAILLALALGTMGMPGCGQAPGQDAGAVKTAEPTEIAAVTPEPTEIAAVTPEPTETPTVEVENTPEGPVGYITSEEVRYNQFLTSIVQQNIENSSIDLDEDAELVRFAFGYMRWYFKGSVIEREEDGVECRILSLEQVNAVLSELFGRTIEPDGDDYSIPEEDFNCTLRDGVFCNTAPFAAEEFSFPVRFALVERIDRETNSLHFRLYRMNPYVWGVGEAERHVPIMPMMSIYEAENGTEETQLWTIRIAEGDAVLRDTGDGLQLVELTTTLKP